MNLTKKTPRTDLLMQVMDPNKVTLTCGVHNYVPGRDIRKNLGCAQCIMADFVYMFARVPREKQMEELEKFEALIHTMCELEDTGKLDINIQRHPTLEIEKDALPDA